METIRFSPRDNLSAMQDGWHGLEVRAFNPVPPIRIVARPKLEMPGEHWGVEYLPDTVMHLGVTGLRTDSLEEFLQGRPWRVVRSATWYERDPILARVAEAERNPPKYHLTNCNCEIFANWLFGQPLESPQVNGVAFLGLVAAAIWATL